MPEHAFDLTSAVQAGVEGRLREWVGEFLASPGSDNEVLAAALAQRPLLYLGPVRLDLRRLTPMAGPDEDVVVPIDETEWEGEIGDMVESLDEGWEPPPLLVSSRDGGLFLEDGNHRHESLRRAGETHGWAIVLCESEADHAALAAELGDERRAADALERARRTEHVDSVPAAEP